MYFKVRISKSYEECKDKLVEWFAPHSPYICYEHVLPNNVHIHLLLDYHKKEDTLRKIFKKIYNSEDWSVGISYGKRPFTKPVNQSFVSYMSKGKFDPVFNNLLTDERVAELKLLGYDKDDVIVPVVTKAKRKTKRELVDLIFESILEQKQLNESDLTLQEELEVIRRVLIRHNEVLGYYKIIDIYDAYLTYYSPTTLFNSIANRINSRV